MNTVSTASILGMAVSLILCIGLPVALYIVLKVKTKAKFNDMLLGAVSFILFALVLEQILHSVILGTFGEKLTGNLWLYALYGGAAAAVFEECGRLITMKVFFKKHLEKENALMYGVGHGGIEAVLVGGYTCIANLATVAIINGGTLEAALAGLDEAARASSLATISQLWTLPSYIFFMTGIERVIAVVLQIALSYLVYRAVRYHRWGFFAAAMGIHFAVDAATKAASSFLPIPALEAILAVVVALIAFATVRLYRNEAAQAKS
ncbi:MAG: YhfC family glutamic-type intramembrane protease [Firmicutes bacterium]|nr:YhfC family glutamic-type intramembrane protease [Bacillota bacterium]